MHNCVWALEAFRTSTFNQKDSLDLSPYANLGLRTELRAQACLASPASPSFRPHLVTVRPAQARQLQAQTGLCEAAVLP